MTGLLWDASDTKSRINYYLKWERNAVIPNRYSSRINVYIIWIHLYILFRRSIARIAKTIVGRQQIRDPQSADHRGNRQTDRSFAQNRRRKNGAGKS